MTPCARCDSPLEAGDLRCAVCALTVPVEAAPAPVERARILRCTWCNAAVEFDPAHQAPACAFCRSVMTIEQPHDPVETARAYVAFGVPRELATSAAKSWLARRGWFAPATLHDEAVLESLTPVYWPAWLVDARAHVTWTADSDAGSRRSKWAPHAGETDVRFDRIVVPASRGLSEREAEALAPHYDLDDTRVLADADVQVEGFDAQRSAARAIVGEAITERARTAIEDEIPGSRYRNVHVACLVEALTTDRVALPAWVLAYRFRGAPYRAIVHGQRHDVVIGTSPIDWGKVARVAGIVLAAVAVIALIYFGRR
ncbi:MAG: zinc ribbon domain-containing protein [Deltaproteobacteria bacterium]|nr:zinc ribbon domain-containing protein [Deltaproteobacteria bacterium]